MQTRTRPYIGIRHDNTREMFRASAGPTEELYGTLYAAVIGPFRTVRGAEYMLAYGKQNPHCRCVSEAERLAELHKGQSELCASRIAWLDREMRGEDFDESRAGHGDGE